MPVDLFDCSVARTLRRGERRHTFVGFDRHVILEEHLVRAAHGRIAHEDDDARGRLVDNVVGHLLNGVSEPVLERAFTYWRNVDPALGDRIADGVRAKQDETDPKAADQDNPARASAQAKA